MRNKRGIGNDHNSEQGAIETRRDVLAFYRAALDHDHDALGIIINETRCLGCLSAGIAQVGLWLAADECDIIPGGGYAPWFASQVQEELDHLQWWLDGVPPPPGSPEAHGR